MSHRPADQEARERGGAAASRDELDLIDAYWRAANYLSVGQIYLLDNPLLREPLQPGHVKPRLLGHWGTTPGLNFIYAHLNRVIRSARPGHDLRDRPGTRRPRRWWRTPTSRALQRGLSAHRPRRGRAARSCSGSSRSPAASQPRGAGDARARSTRAASSATRSRTPTAPPSTTPTSLVCCIVGDGEAETGPLAASWHSNKFLDPVGDGAVLPILHLNGYKIANPTVLARIGDARADVAARGLRAHRALRRRRRAGDDAPADGDASLDDGRRRDRGDPATRARVERTSRAAALADDRAAHAEGLDRPEDGRRPAGGGHLARRTRCRSPRCGRTRSTSRSSRRGCAATGRRSCSTRTGRSCPSSPRCPRAASGG